MKILQGILLIWCFIGFPLAMASCEKRPKYNQGQSIRANNVDRFNKGDIIYLKPDSTKAVVLRKQKCGCKIDNYIVYYFNKNGDRVELEITEELIFLR
jgi:hypothetical protein